MARAKVDWSSFTKAELIRTIKSLDARQTKLLNRVAALQSIIDASHGAAETLKASRDELRNELDLLKARPVVAATAYGEHDVEDLRECVVHVTQDREPSFPWSPGYQQGDK